MLKLQPHTKRSGRQLVGARRDRIRLFAHPHFHSLSHTTAAMRRGRPDMQRETLDGRMNVTYHLAWSRPRWP